MKYHVYSPNICLHSLQCLSGKTNIFDLRTQINIILIIETVSYIFWPTLFTHSKHKTKMPNDISKIMNCDSIDGKYAAMLFLEYGYI